jgi:dihydroneopterin aldolase
MFDLIRIVNLEIWSVLGVSDEEREHRQRLLVSLELRIKDIGPAAYNDNVKMTVDYAAVAEQVKITAELRPRHLIETLGEEIATDLLKTFSILSVKIEIKKYVLTDADHVSLIIERPMAGRLPTAFWPRPRRSVRRPSEGAPNR